MIYAFNFLCERDQALSELMQDTLIKYGAPNIAMIRPTMTGGRKYTNYGNGAGWIASMMKLEELSYIVDNFDLNDDDFILSVDSDVVFTSSEVFKYVNPEYGIIGILGQQPWNTSYGKWAHMSGCLIFIRADIAKKMAALSDDTLNYIRNYEFKPCMITENEDVVLSYLAMKFDAKPFDLSSVPGLTNGDFEHYVKIKQTGLPLASASFYHLNYNPETFLGEKVNGKWDIAGILHSKNIIL